MTNPPTLREALERVVIGGNHLALLIGADHPPYTATSDTALEHYGAGDAYEAWCCWSAIMNLRAALSAVPEDDLVKRIRSFTKDYNYDIGMVRGIMDEAADRIEALGSPVRS